MATRDSDVTAPPYIPFKTLMNLIVRMEDEGLPRRVDRSYLNNMSGAMQAAVMASLRSLGLTGTNGETLSPLAELVDDGDNRAVIMRDVLAKRYQWAITLGEESATQSELDEAFRDQGISGSTLRKAVAFYLRAAKYAELPLSPFFQTPREDGGTPRKRAASGGRRPKRRAAAGAPLSVEPTSPIAVRPADGSDMKRAYFEMLLEQAKAAPNGTPDADLLNRIERLLGILDTDALPNTGMR